MIQDTHEVAQPNATELSAELPMTEKVEMAVMRGWSRKANSFFGKSPCVLSAQWTGDVKDGEAAEGDP